MSSRVGVIDYDMGNLHSIVSALAHEGGDVQIVRSAADLAACDRVVLPGVGAFGASMRNLHNVHLVDAIHEYVARGRPFLGICLGFQVLFEHGTEYGQHIGLGLFKGSVDRFETKLHVPHVGWNELIQRQQHPLFAKIGDDAHMYFVHSFRPVGVSQSVVIGQGDYDGNFVCAVAHKNVAGMQFHPEKSGADGLQLLANFLHWAP